MDYKIAYQPLMNKLMPFEGVTFQIPISIELAKEHDSKEIIKRVNNHVTTLLNECVKEGDESEHDVTVALTIIDLSYTILNKGEYSGKYSRENGLSLNACGHGWLDALFTKKNQGVDVT